MRKVVIDVEAMLGASGFTQDTLDRIAAVQKRLTSAGVLGMSFTPNEEVWGALSREQRANEICAVLEAVLDGKVTPAEPLNDYPVVPQ